MPAPFLLDLCGYRAKNEEPNVSDNNDAGSKELSRALFEILGVQPGRRATTTPGNAMEAALLDDLRQHRPDLDVRKSREITDFDQYTHLGVFRQYRKNHKPAATAFEKLEELAASVPPSRQTTALRRAIARIGRSLNQQDELAARLLADMPEESFLKVDLTIGESHPDGSPRMLLGLFIEVVSPN